jgi:quercetin dioxygenase-like cupin family protein
MAVIFTSYRDAVSFRPEKFNPVVVGASTHMKALLTCLEAGQFIPVHRPKVDMLLTILEGEGRVVAGDREEAAGPGTTVFVPAGEARGLKADSRIVALHVVSPPPGDSDHAEVGARLKQGEWR